MPTSWISIAVLLGLLLLPACGEDEEDSRAATDTVRVTLEAFRIEMPDTLPVGLTAFEITNRDTLEHSFRVEQRTEDLPQNLAPDAIEEELASSLAPDQTGTLVVDLRPSEFRAYCPLADHEQRSMRDEFTAGPRSR